MKIRALILTAATMVALGLLVQFVHPFVVSSRDETVLVTKIIDGDTIIVEGGRSVRLLGIDAHERGQSCYKEAAEELSDLVLNKQVRLEADSRDKDKYNRYLRWIWLGDKLINEQLVSDGLAIARISDETKYAGQITSAESAALEEKTGCLWAE